MVNDVKYCFLELNYVLIFIQIIFNANTIIFLRAKEQFDIMLKIYIDPKLNIYRFLKSKRMSPIEKILMDIGIDYKCTDIEYADYLIIGPHLSIENYLCSNNKIIIFITGEAVTPDFNLVDYAFGYDPIIFGDRYRQIYFQYLFYDINIGERELAEEDVNLKTKFCNFLYSHSFQIRDDFFQLLSEYKKVDSLGYHLNNVGKKPPANHYNIGDWFSESIGIKKPYKFSITFESAFHLGYTTEKIFSSMLANTIPIYWGNPEIGNIVNTESIINCHEFKSFDNVVSTIKEIDENDEYYINMLKKPWLKNDLQIKMKFEMEEIFKKQIIHIFSQDYKKAFRKPSGTYNDYYKKNVIGSKGLAKQKINLIKNFKKLNSVGQKE